jgi:hypothetical protein
MTSLSSSSPVPLQVLARSADGSWCYLSYWYVRYVLYVPPFAKPLSGWVQQGLGPKELELFPALWFPAQRLT